MHGLLITPKKLPRLPWFAPTQLVQWVRFHRNTPEMTPNEAEPTRISHLPDLWQPVCLPRQGAGPRSHAFQTRGVCATCPWALQRLRRSEEAIFQGPSWSGADAPEVAGQKQPLQTIPGA